MFDLKIKFSILGVIIFILPMLINLVYFKVAPQESSSVMPNKYRWIEWIEQATRMIYMVFICLLVSKHSVSFKSPYLYLSLFFLILYYIVWIRYFISGMQLSVLKENFLFVPMPLVIFPVLYFIFSALWLNNLPAVITMIIFGVAHYFVSYMTL